jgi:hypothetical protein
MSLQTQFEVPQVRSVPIWRIYIGFLPNTNEIKKFCSDLRLKALEIKTGRSGQNSREHRAQLHVYSHLIRERYCVAPEVKHRYFLFLFYFCSTQENGYIKFKTIFQVFALTICLVR